MQVNDITSYLYSAQAGALQKTAATGSVTSAQALDSETAQSFAELLTQKTNDYSQMSSLAAVLNKSVLGSVTTGTDLSALSEELLNTSSGREVVSKLAEGHLNAIAMSDNEDEDDSTSITNALNETATADTDTLQQILDKLNEIASNGASQK